jgi:hypothetical protein
MSETGATPVLLRGKGLDRRHCNQSVVDCDGKRNATPLCVWQSGVIQKRCRAALATAVQNLCRTRRSREVALPSVQLCCFPCLRCLPWFSISEFGLNPNSEGRRNTPASGVAWLLCAFVVRLPTAEFRFIALHCSVCGSVRPGPVGDSRSNNAPVSPLWEPVWRQEPVCQARPYGTLGVALTYRSTAT